MGREQKRREFKKNKNNYNKNITVDTTPKVSTLVKTILVVVIVLLVIYYALALFVTKEISLGKKANTKDTTSESTNETNVSNQITASRTFEQSDTVYYVYYYDFNDENENISSAINNLTDNAVYRVDTSSGFNKNYVTEDNGNKNVTDINNLKVKNPTIIKIDNDKVVAYHEGENDIIKFINNE